MARFFVGTFFCWYERRYTSWHSMYYTIFVVLTAKSSMFSGDKKANFPEYSRTFIRMTRLECHVGGCFHMPPCSSDKSVVWSSFEHPQSDALKNQLFFGAVGKSRDRKAYLNGWTTRSKIPNVWIPTCSLMPHFIPECHEIQFYITFLGSSRKKHSF